MDNQKFPYQPNLSQRIYSFIAYSPEGKVYVCAQQVDTTTATVILGKTNEYNYSIKGNEITWNDEKGSETISYLLKDDRFTTITKNDIGNMILFSYKRAKSPTLEEIINAGFIK